MRASRVLLASVAIGCLFAVVRPAGGWQVSLDGTGPGPGVAGTVAVASNGDVIAGGQLDHTFTGIDFTVARLAAADGAERWRRVLPGPTGDVLLRGHDTAVAVALDPLGDVVAAGRTSAPGVPVQYTVVKLAGATGAVLWRWDEPSSSGKPIAIAVAADGDVYVASSVVGEAGGFPVLTRRASDTGLPIWTYVPTSGLGTNYDVPIAVALHASGDPILLATTREVFAPQTSVAVARVGKETGTAVWNTVLAGSNLGLLRAGEDVYALTAGHDPTQIGTSMVHSLAGQTGFVRWKSTVALANDVVLLADGNLALLETKYELAAPTFRTRIPTMLRVEVRAHDNGSSVVARDLPLHDAGTEPPCPCAWPRGAAIVLDPPSGDLFVAGSYQSQRFFAARLDADDLGERWRVESSDLTDVPGSYWALAAARVPGGTFVVGGGWRTSPLDPRLRFTVTTLGADGAVGACGDGTVDADESCDDGELVAGTCCPADCAAAEPDGTVCDDGSVCTLGDRCKAGRCAGESRLPCEPCGTCDAARGCLAGADDACRHPTRSATSRLSVASSRSGGKGSFAWSLRSGAETSLAELGDPRADTSYAVCGISGDGRVVLRAVAPAGSCARGACWRRTARGFRYADPNAPQGVSRLVLRSGSGGRARFDAEGGGSQSVLPALPLEPPLRMELRRVDEPGICWAANHAGVRRNTARRHRAIGG